MKLKVAVKRKKGAVQISAAAATKATIRPAMAEPPSPAAAPSFFDEVETGTAVVAAVLRVGANVTVEAELNVAVAL
jgi:hypothetical protein